MRKAAFIIFTAMLLAFDLMTKSAAVLKDRAVFNTGVSFGLFTGISPLWQVSLTAVIFACLILILILFEPDIFGEAGIAMMAAGALGNLFDRIFLGYVRDWLFVPFSKLIFADGLYMNIADAALALGALFIFISFLRSIFTLKLR